MTYRNNDDKYIYLPKVLASRGEESIKQLRKDLESSRPTRFTENTTEGISKR